MLEASQLTAVRDNKVLFESLSFTLDSGDLVQVEGRNGTGKTTLLRIITGLAERESGDVFWNGQNIESNREAFHQNLLFLGHQTGIKRELTAYENLRFYLNLHSDHSIDKTSIYKALMKVGLVGREDVPVAKLSAGQQRRVALARLWLSQHKLWILDEPLTAIDKQGVSVLESLFLEHIDEGGIVLLTTHQDMFTEQQRLKKITLGNEPC